jgi:multidrug efflux pump subunit AcrA (membrane-fusion protein)
MDRTMEMTDFEATLRAKLARNAELAEERAQAEQEMDRAQREAAERAERQAAEQLAAQRERHGVLVDALTSAAQGLKSLSPEGFIVRMGWTQSGEEFIAKISTRLVEPARSLLVELDRDDDEVLARWHSDVGNTLELWRLLEVTPALVEELVLAVADQELWKGRDRPPPFPKA